MKKPKISRHFKDRTIEYPKKLSPYEFKSLFLKATTFEEWKRVSLKSHKWIVLLKKTSSE